MADLIFANMNPPHAKAASPQIILDWHADECYINTKAFCSLEKEAGFIFLWPVPVPCLPPKSNLFICNPHENECCRCAWCHFRQRAGPLPRKPEIHCLYNDYRDKPALISIAQVPDVISTEVPASRDEAEKSHLLLCGVPYNTGKQRFLHYAFWTSIGITQ